MSKKYEELDFIERGANYKELRKSVYSVQPNPFARINCTSLTEK